MSIATQRHGRPTATAPGNAVAELVRSRSMHDGDAVYLTEARGSRQVSFRDLEHRVASRIAELDDRAVVADATVGIAVADPLEFAVLFLAVMASGRWVAPIDPSSSPEAIATAVSRLEIALL